MKKELNVLKKRYPQKDSHARDYAQFVGSVADVEEKAAMIDNQTKGKLTKQKDAYAKITPEAEEKKRKLKEDLGKESQRHRQSNEAPHCRTSSDDKGDGGKHKNTYRNNQKQGKRYGATSGPPDPKRLQQQLAKEILQS